jgi:magnesium-transporting ATPase (P-type)
MSTVVLFSFYKNAIMAGILIVFSSRCVYSGTPLFDEWLIAMLNFVVAMPIIMTGLFDRCLSKEYVRAHPEVYKATRQNELITARTLLRWIIMTVVHVFTLFLFTVPQQSNGGGMTSAFVGLMRNENSDSPGDGEGGDLKSVGTVTYTCMVVLLAYKVRKICSNSSAHSIICRFVSFSPLFLLYQGSLRVEISYSWALACIYVP